MTPALARQIRAAVKLALAEDLGQGDATTSALFPKPLHARGTIIAHQAMTLAGIAVAKQTFHAIDASLKLVRASKDGSKVEAGSILMVIAGDARSLLMAERVALNFLQRLSGIATHTARFCDAVRGYCVKILDTRKTTPGLRALEKWAVKLGGGHNHRHSLGDGVLIKDNHLALAGHDVAAACRLARERAPHGLKIEVEAKTLDEVRAALDGKADIIAIAREMMCNPYWPAHAARTLGLSDWLNVLPENYAFRLYPREEELLRQNEAVEEIPFRRKA